MAYICKLTDIFSSFKLKKTTAYFLSDLSDYDRMLTVSSLMFVNFT